MSEILEEVLETIKNTTKKVELITNNYEYITLLQSVKNPDPSIVEAYFQENK